MTKIAATFMMIIAILFTSSASAAERGTAEEAVALVKKTVEILKTNPADQLYAAINNKDSRFIDRDLYVFIQDMKGFVLAHAVNPKLVGKDASENQDADGKFYVKERMETAAIMNAFWHDYKFADPMTKKISQKSGYCEQTNDVLICVGIYK